MTYRQGDLLIRPVKEIKGRKQKNNIVALGEATGHSHTLLKGDVYRSNGKKFLVPQELSKLVHDEHKPIDLPTGKYEVTRQKEYKPAKVKASPIAD